MNKKDKQILEMLEKEMKSEVEKVNVPLRLQKESIVKMLKNAEKDFSVETGNTANSGGESNIAAISNENANESTPIPASDGTKVKTGGNIIMLRKIAAIAAMLAIVITGTIIMRPNDNIIKAVSADTFHEGLKDKMAVKDPDSINDIVQAISEIGKSKNKNDISVTDSVTHITHTKHVGSNAELTSAPAEDKTTVPATIIGSYEDYVAGQGKDPSANEDSGVVSAPIASKDTEGIATYGEFKADIVKTDGKYIYIRSMGSNAETNAISEKIKIIKPDGGSIEDVSTIVLSESAGGNVFDECIEIYLTENRLVAIMCRREYKSTGNPGYCDNSTVAMYYDITDPYAPVKIREHVQDGKYVSSNHYEGKLCLVTEMPISENTDAEGHILPTFSVDGNKVELKPEDIRIAVNDAEASYLFITVTDSADFTKGVGRFAFLGGGSNIYCSSSAVVAVRSFVSVEENKKGEHSTFAEVHRINIDGSNVRYSGWYRLKGTLVGGISVDDSSGYLRAITVNNDENLLYMIDKYMQNKDNKVFKILLNGQKPTRVNFIGNNCYVMYEDEEGEHTAVIDLSDQSASEPSAITIPKKAFTDSLYELSDTMVVEISGASTEIVKDENGEDHVFIPVTMTLFDVSDPANPVAASTYSLGEGFCLVESFDSNCLSIDSEKKIFGIPVLKYNNASKTQSSEYLLFNVSDGKLVQYGSYVHDASYISDGASRGVFIGDVFYSVSGTKVVAFDISASATENNKLTEFPLN